MTTLIGIADGHEFPLNDTGRAAFDLLGLTGPLEGRFLKNASSGGLLVLTAGDEFTAPPLEALRAMNAPFLRDGALHLVCGGNIELVIGEEEYAERPGAFMFEVLSQLEVFGPTRPLWENLNAIAAPEARWMRLRSGS